MSNSKHEINVNFLDFVALILKRKVFLAVLTFLICGTTAVISLCLPMKYTATTVLMPPENQMMGGLLSQASLLKFGANSLFSSQSDIANTFISIFSSRTLKEDVIRRFNLDSVYQFTKQKKYYMEDVIKALNKHISMSVTDEGTIIINVVDRVPQRSSDMANYIVSKLDEINRRLSTETARNQRLFFEERISIIKQDLDSAETRFTRFQKANSIVSIEDQTKATIEANALLEAKVLSTELDLSMARKVYGSGPRITELEMSLNLLRKQMKEVSDTKKSDLFIPLKLAPDLGLEFIRLKRELAIQETLFELVTQQFEKAKLEEAKQTPSVQILDPAIVPEKRSSPKRTKMVMYAFILSIFVGIVFISVNEYWMIIKANNSEEYIKIKALLRLIHVFKRS